MVENSYKTLYLAAVEALESAQIEDAVFDSSVLFGECFGKKMPEFKFTEQFESLPDEKRAEEFVRLVRRRIEGEPLQYIVGRWEFYGLELAVGRGVLIPRQDTETLVGTVINKAQGRRNLEIIDLCAGSGCVGLALEKHLDVKGLTFVEKSAEAACYLQKNIAFNKSRGQIIIADVTDKNTPVWCEKADIIVCNPPYLTSDDMAALQKEVTYEPQTALFGGSDGLDFYRHITRIWKEHLKDEGIIAFEIGIGMEGEVSEILIAHGFKNVRFHKDLNGIYRVVSGEKTELALD